MFHNENFNEINFNVFLFGACGSFPRVGVWYLSLYLRTPVSGQMYTIQQLFYCIQSSEADIFLKILYPNFRYWYFLKILYPNFGGWYFLKNIVFENFKIKNTIIFYLYCIQIFDTDIFWKYCILNLEADIFTKILYPHFRGWYFSVHFRYNLRVSCCPLLGAVALGVIFSHRQ